MSTNSMSFHREIRNLGNYYYFLFGKKWLLWRYYKTCVRQPPLKLTLVADVER